MDQTLINDLYSFIKGIAYQRQWFKVVITEQTSNV